MRKKITIVLMVICFTGIISTLYLMKDSKDDIKINLQIESELENNIDNIDDNTINIDFAKLRKTNNDTVGYIDVPITNTNYIVVKGKDNDYYLKHNFKKKYNLAGWIFADYRNKADGTDQNLVIFGHDSYDGSMFGSLSKLLKKDINKDKDNLIINYITDKGQKKYKIFSIYTIKPETYYITTSFENNEFEKFKKIIKERSIYKIDVDIDNKNIITLSTCQNHGVKRLAIHAIEI